MDIEVLVATMNQSDYSLLDEMNIKTDVIVGNQCGENAVNDFERDGHNVKWLSFDERGVGLNRNNALMRASGDIVVFADEDVVYYDDYENTIKEAFEKYPEADGFIFNIDMEGERAGRVNKKVKRLRWYNSLNYGTVRLAVKRDSVLRENINFSLVFGGGTMYSCGEDTIFIQDCLKKGLKLYTYPASAAKIKQSQSTWFEGYTDKYFYDKGALMAAISKRHAKFLCFLLLLKNRKIFGVKFSKAYGLMKQGIKGFKTLTAYGE